MGTYLYLLRLISNHTQRAPESHTPRRSCCHSIHPMPPQAHGSIDARCQIDMFVDTNVMIEAIPCAQLGFLAGK